MRERLPWEIVETFPSTDAELIGRWRAACAAAQSTTDRIHTSVGLALVLYWAYQEGLEPEFAPNLQRRTDLIGEATDLARGSGEPDHLATALLGELYALWGPDHFADRDSLIEQLESVVPSVNDEELRLRAAEWQVLHCFHTGDVEGARERAARFASDPVVAQRPMFARREELWRANLEMIEGHLDEALRINTGAISSTAADAGSPFSFQNVAVTMAIERYLRRQLDDVVESVRSIRASSPRVGANWDAGLAFSLAETGRLDEAAELFDALAARRFASVPRDLNWLVTMHLLALVAVHLDDGPSMQILLEQLAPMAPLDAVHGAGYASYGPVGRVVALLAASTGEVELSRQLFESTLARCPEGPWRSLGLFDRARVFARSDPRAAFADVSAAARGFERFDMTGWVQAAASLRADLAGSIPARPTVVREGEAVVLHHELGSARVSGKGAQHLVELLRSPGEFHDVTALEGSRPGRAGRFDGSDDSHGSDAQGITDRGAAAESSLDATASREYRRRIRELEARGERISADERSEIEFLRRELAGAAYFVSRSSEDERARVRVTKAMKRCMDAICEQAPALGAHLVESVSTGRACMYAPGDGRSWDVVTDRGSRAN